MQRQKFKKIKSEREQKEKNKTKRAKKKEALVIDKSEYPASFTDLDILDAQKYRPEFCEQLISHMGSGFPVDGFALKLRVTGHVLRFWRKKYPEFEKAFKIGQYASDEFYHKLLFKSAMDKKVNANVTMFLAKNKLGMTDKVNVQLDNTEGTLVIRTSIGEDGVINKDQKFLAETLKDLTEINSRSDYALEAEVVEKS